MTPPNLRRTLDALDVAAWLAVVVLVIGAMRWCL